MFCHFWTCWMHIGPCYRKGSGVLSCIIVLKFSSKMCMNLPLSCVCCCCSEVMVAAMAGVNPPVIYLLVFEARATSGWSYDRPHFAHHDHTIHTIIPQRTSFTKEHHARGNHNETHVLPHQIMIVAHNRCVYQPFWRKIHKKLYNCTTLFVLTLFVFAPAPAPGPFFKSWSPPTKLHHCPCNSPTPCIVEITSQPTIVILFYP